MRNTGSTLDFDLGDMVGALRNQIEAFSEKEIAPRAAEIDKSNEFPMDLWKKFGDLGFFMTGSTPEAYLEKLKFETERWTKVVKDNGIKVEG